MKTLTKIFSSLMKKNITFYPNSSVIISLVMILFGTGILNLVSVSYAQVPCWTQKTDMPTVRYAHSSIEMGGKIYVIGGTDSIGYKRSRLAFKTVEVYDPILDSWEVKANLNTGRANFTTCVLNGKILAVGGSKKFYTEPLSTIEEYDPVSDTWTHKTDMPRARIGPTASLVNDKIYIIGGGDASLETIAETDVYDTLAKTWTTITDIPTPRINLQAVVLNGKIYAIGGMTGASAGEIGLKTVEEYDPVTDTWTKKADMSVGRKYFDACVLNDKIYVFGGTSGFCSPALSGVEEYDPVTNTWTQCTSLPIELAVHSVTQENGKAYVIGGSPGGIPNACTPFVVSTIYEYNPYYDLLILVEKCNLSSNYVKAGIDSVCIAVNINHPTGVSLFAEIEAPDQTPVDSLQLFDDGNHKDGNAGDSLYANIWPVSSAEEQNYYVDLHVTLVDTETVFYPMNNTVIFTTIGPVVYENHAFTGTDTEPNPGDNIKLELTLKNNGATATANNIEAKLISLDALITATRYSRTFGNMAAGESVTSPTTYTLYIDKEWPGNTVIPIAVEITSDDYIFWRDTFLIMDHTNIEDIIEPVTRIYPNPTNDILNIEVNNAGQQRFEIEIFSITGALIYQKEYKNIDTNFTEQLDLSNYTKGIYMVKVRQANAVYIGKVVVR